MLGACRECKELSTPMSPQVKEKENRAWISCVRGKRRGEEAEGGRSPVTQDTDNQRVVAGSPNNSGWQPQLEVWSSASCLKQSQLWDQDPGHHCHAWHPHQPHLRIPKHLPKAGQASPAAPEADTVPPGGPRHMCRRPCRWLRNIQHSWQRRGREGSDPG